MTHESQENQTVMIKSITSKPNRIQKDFSESQPLAGIVSW